MRGFMAEGAEAERSSYGSCLVLLCVADELYILLMNQCARVLSGVEHEIAKRLLGYFGTSLYIYKWPSGSGARNLELGKI